MKRTFIAAFAALAMTSGAFAADTVSFAKLDADGDGELSLDEAKAHAPTIDPTDIAAVDTDGNGKLSSSELQASSDSNGWTPTNCEPIGLPLPACVHWP